MDKKAAIYHFTNGSESRPIIYKKELSRIKKFADHHGFSEPDIYLDKTLRKRDQDELKQLLNNIDTYDALIMKDYYHLRKNTGACFSELVRLANKNIKVFTMEDGSFKLSEPPFNDKKKVAIYYCGLEIVERSYEIQSEIMDLFISSKTSWTITDRYADVKGDRTDNNQPELTKLIKNINKYDVILVRSFVDLHWRTAKFCKIRHMLKKSIYSMQEETYLPYEGGK